MLVVSTLVIFMFSLCFCITRLCNDVLSLLHIMTNNHVENGRVRNQLEPGSPQER